MAQWLKHLPEDQNLDLSMYMPDGCGSSLIIPALEGRDRVPRAI